MEKLIDMEFLQPTIAFIIVIGVLVFIHELGHFLAARWTGMRADVFAIGMGPRVMGWNPKTGFSFGKLPADLELDGGTDYRLCALPIGGYVKILGMVDESMDTDFAGRPAEPYEFRSKKNWQKAIVLSAGVIMNFLLAIVVFWLLPLFYGHEEMATTKIAWVDPTSTVAASGFASGDKVISVDGVAVSTWEDCAEQLGLSTNTGMRKVVVQREGVTRTIELASADLVRSMAAGQGLGLYPSDMKIVFGGVVTLSPAGRAGVQAGDVVLAVDSMPVRALPQFQRYVRAHASKPITLHVERNGTPMPVNLTVGSDSTIGVQLEGSYVGPRKTETFAVFESLTMAVSETGNTIAMIGTSVTHVFRGTVSVKQSFGGPIQIAKMASRSSDLGLEAFLRFMALISISLGVMNLLPLPGLDGGHLVFVGIEAVIRREISTNVKIRFQQVGIALLLILMAFVFYLDLTR
ncbi:MAG: RIP metalloprotease RseP [Ignavibacteria bacterium]|nr:RIP metalloprotease RseP [Ignavibacteria bacterium]MBK6419174.1 RIP metalloprotease RseP [Ignavibacteria bacterium]MBK7185962.1 RIP metalloprotease RseP [Ignavibacteria bacterium]MBK7412077.1 RIP metalloprotease RseP [Ignavibacteria bacterium]MBK7575942.1 RIP metalloprotease RseP [Ignavibacteria bacterium]